MFFGENDVRKRTSEQRDILANKVVLRLTKSLHTHGGWVHLQPLES